MDRVTLQIERSLQEKMSKFDIDWSQICHRAIETELKRLNNKLNSDDIDSLIDVDITYNNSEIEEFDVPNFPRKAYQAFKTVWIDSFSSFYPKKKTPTSNQIKQLWQYWYSPFFDEADWWENWDEKKRKEIEKSVSDAYTRNHQYTAIDEQNEFLLGFDGEILESGLDPIYFAFMEFVSKFVFNGEIVEIGNLTPFQLKSVLIENKDDLPEEPGVYFVIDESNIYYIGMSNNIQRRWYSHHKQSYLNDLSNIKISYLDCLPKHYLKNIESTLINHFKPSLNILENPLYKKL